jgi:hypothetical protein
MVVYNYDEECIQIWEITQQAIKTQLRALAKDEDYGDPRTYDIKINKTGEKLETKYMLKPLTKTEFTNQEILNKAKDVRIDALFD